MKYADMNQRQKRAFTNIMYAARWIIGELENTIQDCDEDSPAYQSAQRDLTDHEGLVNYIYDMATTNIYEEGSMFFGPQAAEMIKDIRFCGREWLMERVEKRVVKEGY